MTEKEQAVTEETIFFKFEKKELVADIEIYIDPSTFQVEIKVCEIRTDAGVVLSKRSKLWKLAVAKVQSALLHGKRLPRYTSGKIFAGIESLILE